MDDKYLSGLMAATLIGLIIFRALNNWLKACFFGLGSISVISMAKKAQASAPMLWSYIYNPLRMSISTQIFDKVSLLATGWLCLKIIPDPKLMHFILFFFYLIVFDLVLPNVLATINPEATIIRIFPFLRMPYTLFLPFTIAIAMFANNRKRDQEDDEDEDPEDIKAFIQAGKDEGFLEEKDQSMLKNLLLFDDTLAREVMTPRTDMICVDISKTREEILQVFKDTKFSRIPAYQGNIDNIVGILRFKDMVDLMDKPASELGESLNQPLYVPENRNISDLLADMLKQRIQMAIVIDEYGGTSGLITLENIIEEIVGEIHEEHEQELAYITDLEDGSYLVEGKLLLDEFCEHFNIEIPESDVDTVGGYIFNQQGRIPKVGETATLANFNAEIVEADERRIFKVKITPMQAIGLETSTKP